MSEADDNSNDVVLTGITVPEPNSDIASADADEQRPIMQLFQRLISTDNKQNTVLTNIQIISILRKEFDIDISTLHDLEVDIYISVVKKFLKEWPQWDEFDQCITSTRKQQAQHCIKRTLEKKYRNLKDYLKDILDSARPLAQEAVSQMLEEQSLIMDKVDTSKAILEVFCTRPQLNEFVFSQPVKCNNIFNYVAHKPVNINISDIPLDAILNSWRMQVKIELKNFSYTRTASHTLQHVLINNKNGERNIKRVLNENVQIKDVKQTTKVFKREDFVAIFEDLMNRNHDEKMYKFLETLFTVILSDFDKMTGNIQVPGTYRQHCNKYPYFRILKKEPPPPTYETSMGSTFDLYIEETLAPMIMFSIRKIGPIESLPSKYSWIVIECGECKVKFGDFNIVNIHNHYNTSHSDEPSWICANCEKSFSHVHLIQSKWHHDCESDQN